MFDRATYLNNFEEKAWRTIPKNQKKGEDKESHNLKILNGVEGEFN